MKNAVKEAVETVVRQRVGPERVIAIRVEEDDYPDESGPYVKVVVAHEGDRIDVESMMGATRVAVERLHELGAPEFPILRFLPRADFERLFAATA